MTPVAGLSVAGEQNKSMGQLYGVVVVLTTDIRQMRRVLQPFDKFVHIFVVRLQFVVPSVHVGRLQVVGITILTVVSLHFAILRDLYKHCMNVLKCNDIRCNSNFVFITIVRLRCCYRRTALQQVLTRPQRTGYACNYI